MDQNFLDRQYNVLWNMTHTEAKFCQIVYLLYKKIDKTCWTCNMKYDPYCSDSDNNKGFIHEEKIKLLFEILSTKIWKYVWSSYLQFV